MNIAALNGRILRAVRSDLKDVTIGQVKHTRKDIFRKQLRRVEPTGITRSGGVGNQAVTENRGAGFSADEIFE